MADLSKILRSMADDLEPAGNFRKNIRDAADTIESLQRAFNDDQNVLARLERERDEARGELERLTATNARGGDG